MRIQRMRLRLQWYDITVKYRKGKDMELPDTLSRAQLADSVPEAAGLECVSMLNFVSLMTLTKTKHTQKLYYDSKRANKHRSALQPGDEVRMAPHPGSPLQLPISHVIWCVMSLGMRPLDRPQ
ncbi:hypothetical protein JOB18_039748 [Solea senegalensis]|uniref:Uncharacterized protein n=1 Tax=Solea senegalensis TaxID=28829 RepID=A0AAV6TAM1_SOLSE|nr:hypothetical protein JOB18_039748 [Solea senegalensis]